MSLRHAGGIERLRLTVDSLGAAAIEFLDDGGRVVKRIRADTP